MQRLVIENFRRLNFCRVYFVPSKLTTSVPKDAIKFIMYDGISVHLGNAAERQSLILGKDHYFWEGQGWEDGQFSTEKKTYTEKRYLKK